MTFYYKINFLCRCSKSALQQTHCLSVLYFPHCLIFFLSFPVGTIKSLARETVSNKQFPEGELRRARLLIEFLEHLEKGVYNAAQGTATAMLSPNKLVRTFFDTNKNTCGEWLTRNRMALMVVSLHAGIAASTVRHGFCHLQDLVDAGNTQTTEFQNAVLHVGWAFSRLKEPDAIHGLFVWCRDVAGVSLPYLKPLTKQAASKLETSVENYKKLLINEINSGNSEENEGKSSAHGLQTKTFIADRLTECYLALHDWNQLNEWKEEEKKYRKSENGVTGLQYKHFGTNETKAMNLYANGEIEAACDLLSWSTPEEEPKSINQGGWICFKKMQISKMNLMNLAIVAAAGKLEP